MRRIKDESIFQGWYEFDGYRFEDCGCGIYKLYIKQGNAYIGSGKISIDESKCRSKQALLRALKNESEQNNDY